MNDHEEIAAAYVASMGRFVDPKFERYTLDVLAQMDMDTNNDMVARPKSAVRHCMTKEFVDSVTHFAKGYRRGKQISALT